MCFTRIVLAVFALIVVNHGYAVNDLPDWNDDRQWHPPINKVFEARSIDGYGNNPKHAHYGGVEIPLRRRSGVGYEDKISEPAGATRKSARKISNIVAAQMDSIENSKKVTNYVWQWGQFLDHDLDLTPDHTGEFFNIPVPLGDFYFDPYSTGSEEIFLMRAIFTGGTSVKYPRQQLNVITAYIDASNVYGSDGVRATALRTYYGGKLKTSSGEYLPYNDYGLPNAGGPDPSLFLAGDVRSNEQIGLTAMHTLFVREHNRLCDRIYDKKPDWSDEKIYQMARKIVGAQMQIITYKEFLPIILGKHALKPYGGYQPWVNPGINNEFATAAYRFGHSMLTDSLLRLDENHDVISVVPLKDAFFNPEVVSMHGGIDSILRGLAYQKAQEVDNKIVDGVRNFLFGDPGEGGFDLASLNIQRGRDHGLADYNRVRKAYGLRKVLSFKAITKNPYTQKKLAYAYDGNTHDMDLWVAGLAEDHVYGGLVGETFHKILADQFSRLRDGDRFWYAVDPSIRSHGALIDYALSKPLSKVRLSDIIRWNTDIDDEIPDNVFIGAHDGKEPPSSPWPDPF